MVKRRSKRKATRVVIATRVFSSVYYIYEIEAKGRVKGKREMVRGARPRSLTLMCFPRWPPKPFALTILAPVLEASVVAPRGPRGEPRAYLYNAMAVVYIAVYTNTTRGVTSIEYD